MTTESLLLISDLTIKLFKTIQNFSKSNIKND